ncbi:MAG TPA: hypothetical protein VJG67_02395 [Candidatus Paceibacterota bacterium]
MGNIERDFKKRNKRQDIQKAVLSAIAISGLLAVAVVAPNTIQLLKSFGLNPKRRQKEIIKRAQEKLVQKGFLVYEDKHLKITKRGEEELNRVELNDWKIEKPKKWDGRWRMLIFDIPEYKRLVRDKVRQTLLHIGFVKVQQSVWVYPYDCEDLISLLKADFSIGKDLLYLIVDSMENDKNFRKIFGLL